MLVLLDPDNSGTSSAARVLQGLVDIGRTPNLDTTADAFSDCATMYAVFVMMPVDSSLFKIKTMINN